MKRKFSALGLLALLCALGITACSTGNAAPAVPDKPTTLLLDQAKSLTQQARTSVEADLEAYATKSGNQLAILLVKTTGDENIDDYSADVFKKWGIGQKGKDNGVLLVLAMDDHHGRIEVGYGLEGTLTDVQANAILQNQIFPRLKASDPNEAVIEGERSIRQALGDTSIGAAAQAEATNTNAPASSSTKNIVSIIFVFIFIGAAFLLSRVSRGGGYGAGAVYGTGLGWGMGGSSGGSSSSSGGGFGGFGGGSSGGGGASGSW